MARFSLVKSKNDCGVIEGTFLSDVGVLYVILKMNLL